jgi:two-component system, LytTR family, response regulator LytT
VIVAGPTIRNMLNVLVVDDEEPALEELAYLLGLDPRIGQVRTAATGARALQALESSSFDAVFLDIRMPGLDGLDLARLLDRFAVPPKIVFVTAYESFAVDAFELKAVDYVLKPVSAERLAETVRRIAAADAEFEPADEIIPVELGGVLRFVNRSDVRYVEAHGDYARLHTVNGNHLIRTALATLEDQWRDAGFVRIHRRHLVSVRHIDQLRVESGHCSVQVGNEVLQVSRRHTQELRDLLAHHAPRPRV